MIGLLRAYLYWSVLWGFMVHPALGLKSLAPPLLLGIDLAVMGCCAAYIAAHFFDHARSPLKTQIRYATITCVLLLGYGLAITASLGGSAFEAAKYLAALIRPTLILIALAVHVQNGSALNSATLFSSLRTDLHILLTAQLSIAALQKISPAIGGEFISSLSDQQSAVYALAEGHVSGTFANSIDLSYFLIAAHIVLTQQHWERRSPPPILLSCIICVFIIATGSLTSQICIGIYIAYLWMRSLSKSTQRVVAIFGTLVACTTVYIQLSAVAPVVLDKVDDMMLSRLGLLFVSVPGLFSTMPQRLVTGSGADFDAILTLLNNLPEVPLVFTYDEATSVINDVFWIALVLSIGVPTTLFFVYRIAKLFKIYIGQALGEAQTRDLVRIIWLIVFLAGLLNQILLVRPFTLTLTLGLLPLAIRKREPNAFTIN